MRAALGVLRDHGLLSGSAENWGCQSGLHEEKGGFHRAARDAWQLSRLRYGRLVAVALCFCRSTGEAYKGQAAAAFVGEACRSEISCSFTDAYS